MSEESEQCDTTVFNQMYAFYLRAKGLKYITKSKKAQKQSALCVFVEQYVACVIKRGHKQQILSTSPYLGEWFEDWNGLQDCFVWSLVYVTVSDMHVFRG